VPSGGAGRPAEHRGPAHPARGRWRPGGRPWRAGSAVPPSAAAPADWSCSAASASRWSWRAPSFCCARPRT